MKINLLKKTMLSLTIVSMLSACSSDKNIRQDVETNVSSAGKMSSIIQNEMKTKELADKNNSFISYYVLPEMNDLKKYPRIDFPMKNFSLEEVSVKDAINALAKIMKVGVVFKLDNGTDLANKTIQLNLADGSTLKQAIEQIEVAANLDIYYNSGALVVNDIMKLSATITRNETKSQAYEKIRGYLENKMLLSENEDGFAPRVVLDEMTGMLYISAEPNLIRDSKGGIEKFLNSSTTFATVQLNIYKIDDSHSRAIGFNASQVLSNLYQLSTGGAQIIQNPMFNFNFAGKSTSNRDISNPESGLKAGIQLLETNNIIRSVGSSVITVFNGEESVIESVKSEDYWVPGDLVEQTDIIDGVSTVKNVENKPTTESIEVGNVLKINPRIDRKTGVIHLNVAYSESRIHGYATISWSRTGGDGTAIELKKPLIATNKSESTMVLSDGQYSIFSGSSNKSATNQRSGLPGFENVPILSNIGNTQDQASDSDVLIVVKPIFPKTEKEVFITKGF